MANEVRVFGTFGPTLHTCGQIETMIRLGMTGIRLNLSHSSLEQSREWIEALRLAEQKTGKKVELLIDMKGPELRVGRIENGIHLLCGDIVRFGERVPVPPVVVSAAEKGDRVLLDDGKILAEVKRVGEGFFDGEIILGGKLTSNKSVAIEHKELRQPPLCAEDLENIRQIKAFGVDSVMQPFVRDASDLVTVRETLDRFGANVKVYAKIESESGWENLESLFPVCDEIVIARGDLANAVGLDWIPIVQHDIERRCKTAGKPYMVVTQMLDSMIERPVPTRAEVNDVFHAVYDGASSIMLTGEVANSKNAQRAMKIFTDIVKNTVQYTRKEK